MSLRRVAFLSAFFTALCTLLALNAQITAAQTTDTTSGNQAPNGQTPTADSQLQLTHKEVRCGDLGATRPPKYHIFSESRAKRDDGSEMVEMKLSLHRNDFTEEKIELVSCELRHKYRHEAYADVWMVDDERAVKRARGWDKDDPTVQHEFRVHLIVATKIGEKNEELQTASFNWFPNRDDRQHATEVALE
jgi:hypothetical protein